MVKNLEITKQLRFAKLTMIESIRLEMRAWWGNIMGIHNELCYRMYNTYIYVTVKNVKTRYFMNYLQMLVKVWNNARKLGIL